MAIDSRDKRSSAVNPGSPWRGMLPVADGTVSQADRQHAAYWYRGIAAASPAANVVGMPCLHMGAVYAMGIGHGSVHQPGIVQGVVGC